MSSTWFLVSWILPWRCISCSFSLGIQSLTNWHSQIHLIFCFWEKWWNWFLLLIDVIFIYYFRFLIHHIYIFCFSIREKPKELSLFTCQLLTWLSAGTTNITFSMLTKSGCARSLRVSVWFNHLLLRTNQIRYLACLILPIQIIDLRLDLSNVHGLTLLE